MNKRLKDDFSKRLISAKIESEFGKRIILVTLARHVPTLTEERVTLMPIQGSTIVDYTWERWRSEGVTFRTLAAFQHGKKIPIPVELRKGY